MYISLAGPHTLFGKFETDHLFVFLLTGSIATDVLFYIRTPIAIAMLCSPLHAILVYIYCDRAAREPVAS